MHLALGDERVDERAGVVDGDEPPQLDRAGLRVDLDDRDVGAERERRGSAWKSCSAAQLDEPAVGRRARGELGPGDADAGAPATWKRPAAGSSTMSSGLASR